MAIVTSIAELLRRERIPYTWFRHAVAYTAQEEAAVSHVLGRSWAKVVVFIADDRPVQAVLPASCTVDLEQLRATAGAATLRLAREDEMAALYPDCEVGAMPPFGAIYGQRVFVDRRLVGEPEMVFTAGTHTDAIRMHYGDFVVLANPVVGTFAAGSGPRTKKASKGPQRPRRIQGSV
jgi:Ala-tRNA(Pro) deacylase